MINSTRHSNYDKYPEVNVVGFQNAAHAGWADIIKVLSKAIDGHKLAEKCVLVIDCYPGVNLEELKNDLIDKLNPDVCINAETAKFDESILSEKLAYNITDDRVFGVLSTHQLMDFFDTEKIDTLKQQIQQSQGLVIVYGAGANLIVDANISVYADLARWEIQQRFRRGELGNWGVENFNEDVLKRYKRAFFIEWRVFDKYKRNLLKQIDFLLDTNQKYKPTMVEGHAFRMGLLQATNQPFRVVPFFDPGVWGGQWMKAQFDLDPNVSNYAWCFDCVPEENSLLMRFGDVRVEIPSQDLVLLYPKELMGEKIYARFGVDFPIRFDLLDTMGGQNLSLQVHPLTEYIQQTFGMHYTQDESYYLLDAKEDAVVYLGVKDNVNQAEMLQALNEAKNTGQFDDTKFINQFPAKKHDHFLIPAGVIHCSGADTLVLEISATPYIFTFKLWDWGRLGLDNKPRPIHLEHGEKVIDWAADEKWVKQNLINRIDTISEETGWREERTGLHEREFIETRRHVFSKQISLNTNGLVSVFNLVEGHEILVQSPDNKFEPFVVHYAETFIIPASVSDYTLTPSSKSDGHVVKVIQAYVRT